MSDEDYGDDFAVQTVWNFDEAQSRAIFAIKELCIELFDLQALEELYWSLRALRREIRAKMSEKEKTDIENKVLELFQIREAWIKDKNTSNSNNLYIKLEEFYMYLCDLMKQHGLYFKEAEDFRKAALKR